MPKFEKRTTPAADVIPELTPDQRKAMDESFNAIVEGRVDTPAPVDQYVGRTPAELEEREAQLNAMAAQTQDALNSANERRIRNLEEQLRANIELVQKLAREKGGYTAGVREVVAIDREEQRRQVYQRIIENGGYCTISIHTHEDPAQNFPVDVSVNGHHMRLPRGQQVVIPVSFLEVLDHARVDAWVREVGPDGNPTTVRHERMSYPYSLLDYTGQRLEQIPTAA